MKLIEALKKIKSLEKKAGDLADKVRHHCAISSLETPMYADQKSQVAEWIQAHNDILKEILHLRVSIQKTNLMTDVTIELGGKPVTHSIAEWIHRRRDLALRQRGIYQVLTDRNIKEGFSVLSSGDKVEVKVQRFYDPIHKDKMIALYDEEPMIIDSKLEIVNATTDLIED